MLYEALLKIGCKTNIMRSSLVLGSEDVYVKHGKHFLPPFVYSLLSAEALAKALVGPLGLEPRTHGLKGRCSTIELGTH